MERHRSLPIVVPSSSNSDNQPRPPRDRDGRHWRNSTWRKLCAILQHRLSAVIEDPHVVDGDGHHPGLVLLTASRRMTLPSPGSRGNSLEGFN